MDSDRTYDAEMKLNRYLLVNQHMTPFESIVAWIEIKAPIFVSRQLIRQRTQAVNEASARYIQLPAVWYIPALEDVVMQSKDKKQGGRLVDMNNIEETMKADAYRIRLNENCKRCYESYQQSIDDGIAMEQARLDLHLNHYTHWMTTQNLRNLFISFLSLRDHSHAQGEAQKYARATVELLEPHLPGLVAMYKELIRKA